MIKASHSHIVSRNIARSWLVGGLIATVATGGIVTAPQIASAAASTPAALGTAAHSTAPGGTLVAGTVPRSDRGIPHETTTTTLTSSCDMGQVGPVIFFAAVTSSGRTTPTGTVGFATDQGRLGRDRLDAAGHAALAAPTLSKGVHQIVARYPGTNRLRPSVSALLTQRIGAGGLCPARTGNNRGREHQESDSRGRERQESNSRGRERQEEGQNRLSRKHDGSRPVRITRSRPEQAETGGAVETIRRAPRGVARHDAERESRPTTERTDRQRSEHAKNHSYQWL